MIPVAEMVLRLLLGAVIGGIIGFERESHGRAAGLRTQLIVCVAAVLIMIISQNYHFYLQHIDPSLRIDPARIAAGALMGIGFLGAGVIIKSGAAIRGLTTAASIWIVSVIGLAIGGGFYIEAIVTFLITIIALVSLRRVEKYIKALQFKTIIVSVPVVENVEETVVSILREYGVQVNSVDYEKDRVRGELIYNFNVSTRNSGVMKELFLRIGALEVVKTLKING
ncbi:MAG: MgtC/SapB family protein [Nitrospirae bacterium]|nr:MgtC/SapB family protein [Nitrospirota bacterium]